MNKGAGSSVLRGVCSAAVLANAAVVPWRVFFAKVAALHLWKGAETRRPDAGLGGVRDGVGGAC